MARNDGSKVRWSRPDRTGESERFDVPSAKLAHTRKSLLCSEERRVAIPFSFPTAGYTYTRRVAPPPRRADGRMNGGHASEARPPSRRRFPVPPGPGQQRRRRGATRPPPTHRRTCPNRSHAGSRAAPHAPGSRTLHPGHTDTSDHAGPYTSRRRLAGS